MGVSVQINSLEDMCALMCDNVIPDHSEEHRYVYCLRCGRVLKSEESKILGYGKICAKKMAQEDRLQLFN